MTSYPAFHLPKAPKKSLEINFVDHYDITHNHEQVRELLLLLTNSRKKTIEFMSQFPAPNADALSLVTEYLPLISGLNEAPLPGAEKKEDAPKEGEAEKAPEEAEKGKEKAEVKEEDKKEDKKEEKKEDDKKGKKGKEEEKKGPIALQRAIAYSWSDFSRKERPLSAGGVDFEISSIIFSLGVWNLQISKQLCEDTDESKAESNQKEAFRFCAKAAGVFQYVADKATEEKGDLSDLRPNVSKALVQFSLAEGQAITIERAMKSKHNHNLISALSTDVAKKFQDARDLLVSPNPTPNPDVDESLLAYLDYKIQLYLGLARFYQGEHFAQLEAGSAGKAVKCMEVGLEHLKNAKTQRDKLLTLYPEAKSKLKHIKEYLEVLTESVQERFNKTKKENDMVYFEKLPENADELPEGKCTIEPVAFEFPETDKKRWTPEVYGSLVAKVDALEELKKSKSSGGCCILM